MYPDSKAPCVPSGEAENTNFSLWFDLTRGQSHNLQLEVSVLAFTSMMQHNKDKW